MKLRLFATHAAAIAAFESIFARMGGKAVAKFTQREIWGPGGEIERFDTPVNPERFRGMAFSEVIFEYDAPKAVREFFQALVRRVV